MDPYYIIPAVAFFGSLLTLFSGFGLGTIMLPVFAFFFPAEIAIALTAIVHLANNIFKLVLLGKHAVIGVVLKFGIPSVIASVIGALLLSKLSGLTEFQLTLFNSTFILNPLKVTVGVLIIIFAIIEILPSRRHEHKSSVKFLAGGGFISGFFGGLSGHQGALRTTFLAGLGLNKEAFIATGVTVACFVDIARISVYLPGLSASWQDIEMNLLLISVLAAFTGAYLGKRILGKIELDWLMKLVAVMLVVFGLMMISGYL
jgi:uncharacterized protein